MIVSLTIVRYRKRFVPLALLAMGLHRLPLLTQKGCTFWKLLGTGLNGTFDLRPDWQQWGLLATWNNRDDFERFKNRSLISWWWNRFGCEQWTILCIPLQSHGKWKNKQPFGKPNENTNSTYSGPIAILTRATIKLGKLNAFWTNVDEVAKLMQQSKGYAMSVGIGEAPFYKQGTFSIWEGLDDVKAFAYRSNEHADVIRKTRNERWYREELFARLQPIASYGTINGENPLQYLKIKHL